MKDLIGAPARLVGPVVGPVLGAADRAVRPLVRSGVVRIPPIGGGIVLLEVAGRRTGTVRQVPVLAIRFGSHLFASTVRQGSSWAKNLQRDAAPAVWLNGRRRPAEASVEGDGPAVAHLTIDP